MKTTSGWKVSPLQSTDHKKERAQKQKEGRERKRTGGKKGKGGREVE